MRLTVIKDFVKVMKSFGVFVEARFLAGTLYRFPNGSFIKFVGLDKEDIGKGLRGDVLYVNEADKVNFETYREIASRFKHIYVDFNPNAMFWAHEHLIPRADCDFLKLTFQDNEFLDQGERDEILLYYEQGYGLEYDPTDPDANDYEIINKYWANKWRVYGLGEVGILEGAVYENWDVLDELPDEARVLGIGVDFGWINPQAAVAVYEWNGYRVYDEISYGSREGCKVMAEDIHKRGLEDEVAYCDNAAPQLIQELVDYGVNACACYGKTGLINYAVEKMNKQRFYITARSVNLKNELLGYVWATDSKGKPTGKPIKINDHGMNAIQYYEASESKYDGTYG